MIYRSVTISGFGPHQKSVTYTFGDELTLITGPNGSGKSSIIDAVHWALFGPKDSHRTTSDRTSVICSAVNTARVKLTLETDDDHELIIVRSLTRAGKHAVSVAVDGQTVEAGVTQTQQIITDHLGVTPDVFSAASMITSSPSVPMNTFLIAPVADKKTILGRIVDPSGIWERANVVMRQRLREERKHLASLEGRLELSEEMLDGLGENPEVPDAEAISARRATVLSLIAEAGGDRDLASHRTLAGSVERATRRLASLDRRAETLDDAAEQARDQQAKAADDAATASEVLSESTRILALTEAEINASDKVLDYLSSKVAEQGLTSGDLDAAERVLATGDCRCPNCSVTLGPEALDGIATDASEVHRTRLERLTEYRRILSHRAASLRREADTAEETVATSTRISAAADDRLADIDSQLEEIDTERQEVQQEVQQLTRRSEEAGDVAELLVELDEVEKDLAEALAAKHEADTLVVRRKELSDQIARIESEISRQRVVIDHFSSLVVTTGPDGAVATEMEQLCQDISVAASEAYEEAYDVEVDITVDYGAAASVLVDGRDLTTYSHGEQSRVIPAVITGLSAAVADHLGVVLPPLWDEPSIAVDSVDVDKMISMLTGRGQGLVIVRETDIDAGITLSNDAPAALAG